MKEKTRVPNFMSPIALTPAELLKRSFIALGILPPILIVTLVLFGTLEPRFLSPENIFNVTRQSTFLVILAMGQMLVLITGNFDLSVGSNVALVSVVTTSVTIGVAGANPADIGWAIFLGIAAGLGTGLAIGLINGFGVAVLNINSFIMTLGMMSVAFGLALTITRGTPIYGLPKQFGAIFAYSTIFDVPTPVAIAIGLFVVLYVLLNWTPAGRYLYAIGSNRRAARLSGINTTFYLFTAHVLCALVSACAGVLMTARAGVGEATLGQDMPLQAITACVLASVSLFGGIGRIESVVVGAALITLLGNGMNLVKMSSYVQIMVVGVVMIAAVAADQLRLYLLGQARRD